MRNSSRFDESDFTAKGKGRKVAQRNLMERDADLVVEARILPPYNTANTAQVKMIRLKRVECKRHFFAKPLLPLRLCGVISHYL